MRFWLLVVVAATVACANSTDVAESRPSGDDAGETGGAAGDGAVGIGDPDAAFPGGDAGVTTAECQPGAVQDCYPGDPSQVGVGVCKAGTRTCVGSGTIAHFGDCTGAVTPSPEVCDGSKDENCDGHVDEGCCTTTSYQKDTGLVSGSGTVCCDNGDKLTNASDCGTGANHNHSTNGNCGTGNEGANNGGSACVRIDCEHTVCSGP